MAAGFSTELIMLILETESYF